MSTHFALSFYDKINTYRSSLYVFVFALLYMLYFDS